MKNILKKHGFKAVFVVAPLALAQQAYAAVPTEVTQALTDAKTDSVSVAGMVLGISIAIFGVMILSKFFNRG
nr:MAG TPA: coat protein [Inoviridae sp.]